MTENFKILIIVIRIILSQVISLSILCATSSLLAHTQEFIECACALKKSALYIINLFDCLALTGWNPAEISYM